VGIPRLPPPAPREVPVELGKLGLEGMPDAVACAAYHYLSNSVGGVIVEFMRESDRKAWVNFVPPRWIYPGASICGVPSEVSRAFLHGWYAQNGVSLGNPRLGCTAQTTDGQHGLSGYFLEHDRDLAPDERLQFRPGELPPPSIRRGARPPAADWPPERLAKAERNYAMEYIRPACRGWPRFSARPRRPTWGASPAGSSARSSTGRRRPSSASMRRERKRSARSWSASPPAKAIPPPLRRKAPRCSCADPAGG
jgi:hypothetical protein